MKLVAILLIACVVASTYGKSIPQDLEQEKIFNFVNDFVHQIIIEPTNVLAQNLAGIGSHFFATLAEHGLAVLGKRDIQQLDPRILSVLQNFGQAVVAGVMPAVNQVVQSSALAVTQVLAEIANGNVVLVGKRDVASDPRIIAILQQLGQSIMTEVTNTVNQIVQESALAITQTLAEIATGNVVLVGKRAAEVDPRFLAALAQLGQTIGQQIVTEVSNTANQLIDQAATSLNNAVQQGALAVTQTLAEIANGNIVLVGKRAAEVDARILAALQQLGQTILAEVHNTANQIVQQGALAVTQVLAEIANGNTVLVGKRLAEVNPRFLSSLIQLGQTVVGQIVTEVSNTATQLVEQATSTANQMVQQGALAITQGLAEIANGNVNLIGKRELTAEEERFLSSLVQLGQTIGNQLITEVSNTANQLIDQATTSVNNAVQQGALAVTQTLAEIANGNIVLVGKRDAAQERFLSSLVQLGQTVVGQIVTEVTNTANQLIDQATTSVNNAVQQGALAVTQTLAEIANGNIVLVGKRGAEEIDARFLSSLIQLGQTVVGQVVTEVSNTASQLVDQATNSLNNAVQQGALAITQTLAEIANGNIVLVGKRDAAEERFLSSLVQLGQTVVGQIVTEVSNTASQLVDQATTSLNNAVQQGALAVTQTLAEIANGNIVLVGKRNAQIDQRFLSSLIQLGQTVVGQVVTEVSNTANQLIDQATTSINNAVQQGALAVTQTLAEIANGNIVLVGKRDAEERFLSSLIQLGQTVVGQVVTEVSNTANQLIDQATTSINNAVQQGALVVTQTLAEIANGNIVLVGKRQVADARILAALQQLGQTVIGEITNAATAIVTDITNQANQIVQQGALAVTQTLAEIANGNIVLVGKRDLLQERILSIISNAAQTIANQVYDVVNTAVQNVSYQIAVTLANIAENGLIGKRATF